VIFLGGKQLIDTLPNGKDEVLIGYMTERLLKGLLKNKSFHVFVSNKRLIFVRYTAAMRKAFEKSLDDLVKGKSFKERLSIIANHTYELPDAYLEMSLDQLLLEHAENFSIDVNSIQSIKSRLPKMKPNDKTRPTPYTLTIKTTHKTYKLTPSSHEDRAMIDLAIHKKRGCKEMKS